jgi:hypothetical protein
VPADVREEELEAVGCARGRGDRLRRGLRLGGRLLLLRRAGGGRLTDLEADPLELARELLDLLSVEVELERPRLELSRLDVAALLRAFDECTGLVRLEQFVKLVLRQGLLSPFSPASKASANLLTLGGKSSACQGNRNPAPRTGLTRLRTCPAPGYSEDPDRRIASAREASHS